MKKFTLEELSDLYSIFSCFNIKYYELKFDNSFIQFITQDVCLSVVKVKNLYEIIFTPRTHLNVKSSVKSLSTFSKIRHYICDLFESLLSQL